ncbi:hypothetical protein Tco_1028850 [Tanacetum coccineum]|uniref:Uncharacterized protein n=1 Tax=Tanacetum coccineum TaxID=301880 RepID=A0ABQ5G1S7_9ASTR
MVEKSKLDEDKKGKAVDPSHYRGMIGTLLYLTASRPDLQFAKLHGAPMRIMLVVKIQRRSTSGIIQLLCDRLLTPFYKAFQVTADAPEIYMQEFWASAYVQNRSVRFKIITRTPSIGLAQFRDIFKFAQSRSKEDPLTLKSINLHINPGDHLLLYHTHVSAYTISDISVFLKLKSCRNGVIPGVSRCTDYSQRMISLRTQIPERKPNEDDSRDFIPDEEDSDDEGRKERMFEGAKSMKRATYTEDQGNDIKDTNNRSRRTEIK